MKKIRKINVYLNMWRILPAYLCFRKNRFKEKCAMDLHEWIKLHPCVADRKALFQFGYIMVYSKVNRNIFLNRLHRNAVMYVITRVLFPPMDFCYINVPPEKIGGGFSLQHGFSTIVAAKEIGERCHINQQVTIGYNEDDAPVIGDDVLISAGAIVIGDVHIGNSAKVGAGAVVVKDVPAYATVVGMAARVVKVSVPGEDSGEANN